MRQGDSQSIVEHFAGLGVDLYRGDEHVAVPTMAATLAHVGADNPTRRRCEAHFLIVDGNHRGRVAAIINPRLLDEHGQPYGLLGFFECEDHDDTAHRLLDQGLEWLAKRGATLVRGPINFTTWHDYRLVASNHVEGWIPGEPYHHDYYPRLWAAAGFASATSFCSNWLDDPAAYMDEVGDRAATCRAAGYEVRALASGADRDALFELARVGLAAAWMYSPIERDEFDALTLPGHVDVVAPHAYLVTAADGEPAGFLHTLPVVLDGHQVSVAKTMAVLPEHRARSVGDLLNHTWIDAQLAVGCRDFVWALVHHDRSASLSGRMIREYEVYERKL